MERKFVRKSTNSRAGLFLCVALTFVLSHNSGAQVTEREAADNAFAMQKYRLAADLYRGILEQSPQSSHCLYRLGYCQYMFEEFEEAIASFTAAIQLRYHAPDGYYNIASSYARLGKKKEAYENLETSVAKGYVIWEQISRDPDFKEYRTEERFKKIIKSAQDPIAKSEQASLVTSLHTLWEVQKGNQSGAFTWSRAISAYALTCDLVIEDRRELYLLISYRAPDNTWSVKGADAFGAVYGGAVKMTGNKVSVKGSSPKSAFRVDISLLQPSLAKIEILEESSGKWKVAHEYRLTKRQ